MSPNVKALLEAPIIELDSIDSTNNYAMRLIDADTAQPGLTIVAAEQTQGRGQRGRKWEGVSGQSLMMSIIICPKQPLGEQFAFNAAATVAIAEAIQDVYENCDIQVKWPNDIIVNDKKAGGVLIENVLRGSNWMYSIVGFGLNVNQGEFPQELPYATSLKIGSGREGNITVLRDAVRNKILEYTAALMPVAHVMKAYNGYLYKKGQMQAFSNNGDRWEAHIVQVNNDGTLQVQTANGNMSNYVHGQVMWEWA